MNEDKISINGAVKEVITGMTDAELLEAVEKTYPGYTREALEIAMMELKRRGIPFIDKTADYPPAEGTADMDKEERLIEETIGKEYVCPQCKDKMEPGSIYLRSTPWGWVFHGSSYKHCFFDPDSDEEEEKVIDNNETRPSYRCKKCGLILFEITKS